MDHKKREKKRSKEATVDRPSVVDGSQKKRKEKVEGGHGRLAKCDQGIAKKREKKRSKEAAVSKKAAVNRPSVIDGSPKKGRMWSQLISRV